MKPAKHGEFPWRVRWQCMRYGTAAAEEQRFKTEREARALIQHLECSSYAAEAWLSQWDRKAKVWVIIAYPEESSQ